MCVGWVLGACSVEGLANCSASLVVIVGWWWAGDGCVGVGVGVAVEDFFVVCFVEDVFVALVEEPQDGFGSVVDSILWSRSMRSVLAGSSVGRYI